MDTNPTIYYPNFVDPADKVWYFVRLHNELPWERRDSTPRSEYWYNDFGRPYTYGRGAGVRTYEAKGLHPIIREVRDLLFDKTGVYFEGCFLNRYDGKKDALGWHSDDDPGINHENPIAVVTLGNGREIQYRPIGSPKTEKKSVFLEPGSLFIMKAGMQQTHLHQIPKAATEVGPRISLTFRSLLHTV